MNVFNTANISRIIIYTKIIDIPLNPAFLLFVKVVKALPREDVKMGQDVQKNCLMLIIWHQLVEHMRLKVRIEAWKRALESKRFTVKVQQSKIMISSKNAEKVTKEGKFPCAVCRELLSSIYIFCQFFKCWVHKKYCGIGGTLREDSKFKCQKCASQQTEIEKGFPSIVLNVSTLETAEKVLLSW